MSKSISLKKVTLISSICLLLILSAWCIIIPPLPGHQYVNKTGVLSQSELNKCIENLRSPVPAPYLNGTHHFPSNYIDGFIHETVKSAIIDMNRVEPRQYWRLIEELNNNEYSYSIVAAAWNNLTVSDIISDYFMGRYNLNDKEKGSKDLNYDENTIVQMINEKGGSEWAKKMFANLNEREVEAMYREWVSGRK